MPPLLLRLRSRAALPVCALVVVTAGTVACSEDGGPGRGTGAVADRDEDRRIATVIELRTTLGPAAAQLGTAAATLVEQLGSLHAALPVAPDERRSAVDALVTGPVEALDGALAGFGPELAGDAEGPDAEAVRVALTDARTAGEALARAARDDLAIVERLAGADAQLAALVAAWDEPGSRSQQLQRLAEVAGEAEALAAELSAVEDAPACAGPVPRRVEAARSVAAASTELRSLVESRRGDRFDARRSELAADPYGLGSGTALVDLDRDDSGCWTSDGPVVVHAGEVAAALEALEAALNPPDLATG